MTSDGLQHSGREPDEAVPGAAGPAPHGNYPPETEHRFPPPSGAPGGDPGWPAPPGAPSGWGGSAAPADSWAPTAGRPDPAPWGGTGGAPDAQPGANAWAPQGGPSWPEQQGAPQGGSASWPEQQGAPSWPEQQGAPSWPEQPAAGGSGFPPERGASAAASPSVPPRWPGEGGDLPARPVVPDATPWPAAQAWGTADTSSRGEPSAGGPSGGDVPVYQPAPGPGISPANAVPLPPQETRVPGASLAASPPADYVPPSGFGPAGGYSGGGYQGESGGAGSDPQPASWAPEGFGSSGRDEPHQASAAVPPSVPQQRPPSESAVAGRVSIPQPGQPESAGAGEPAAGSQKGITASASVPVASRVLPSQTGPQPAGMPAPKPRVYGRPAGDSPAEPDQPGEAPPQRGTGYGEPSGLPGGFGEPPSPPGGFGDPGATPGGGYGQPGGGPAPFGDRFPQAGAAAARATPPAAPPAFPGQPPVGSPFNGTGAPPFPDLPDQNRPVNGTHLGGPARANVPGRFDAPPGAPAAGLDHTALAPAVPPGGAPGYPPAGPPQWGQPAEADQGRFDAFKPDGDAATEPKTEAPPTPKVRNGRVLLAVLAGAVLLLVIPLGTLWLLGKFGGGSDKGFNPEVGACVRQEGAKPAPANCSDAGAFKVVSKVSDKEKCADPAQPHIVVPNGGDKSVLCLQPAAAGQ
ncbi:hypothetical protein AB0J86_01870 [Micromonospora sp. NPDC049559]|uniref:LppU/SCO3897 family protein n=1 Tax=Micromonospora sp. NPDC049559 TaxID=3155923 RepID=UPI0034140684